MASIRCGGCQGTHVSVQRVKDCYDLAAELENARLDAQAEITAEAISSWCAGGGNYADAQVYARVIASGQTWDEYLASITPEFSGKQCEHGLALELCCGPQHYPLDGPDDF